MLPFMHIFGRTHNESGNDPLHYSRVPNGITTRTSKNVEGIPAELLNHDQTASGAIGSATRFARV